MPGVPDDGWSDEERRDGACNTGIKIMLLLELRSGQQCRRNNK